MEVWKSIKYCVSFFDRKIKENYQHYFEPERFSVRQYVVESENERVGGKSETARTAPSDATVLMCHLHSRG